MPLIAVGRGVQACSSQCSAVHVKTAGQEEMKNLMTTHPSPCFPSPLLLVVLSPRRPALCNPEGAFSRCCTPLPSLLCVVIIFVPPRPGKPAFRAPLSQSRATKQSSTSNAAVETSACIGPHFFSFLSSSSIQIHPPPLLHL